MFTLWCHFRGHFGSHVDSIINSKFKVQGCHFGFMWVSFWFHSGVIFGVILRCMQISIQQTCLQNQLLFFDALCFVLSSSRAQCSSEELDPSLGGRATGHRPAPGQCLQVQHGSWLGGYCAACALGASCAGAGRHTATVAL